MTDCFDLYNQTNGSWYPPATRQRPERSVIPAASLPAIVHYAVETEPAYYTTKTHITSVPGYLNTVPAVSAAGPSGASVSQGRLALDSVISRNQASIDQILHSTYRR